MKVLSNAAELRAQAERDSTRAAGDTDAGRLPDHRSTAPDPHVLASQDAARAARRAPQVRIVHRGVRVRTARARRARARGGRARPGSTSARPGSARGSCSSPPSRRGSRSRSTGSGPAQTTPAVIEDVLPRGAAHRDARRARGEGGHARRCRGSPGKLVARVHVRLESIARRDHDRERARRAPRSCSTTSPPGRTPVTLGDVRLDERHRIDLVLAGHEIDQFVVLPGEGRRPLHAAAAEARAEGEGAASP